MATHSRLSMLVEGLSISSLLLCLCFFSSCDATSRSIMENMEPRRAALANDAATTCGGRTSCKTVSSVEPDMMQSEVMHMSSRDSAAAAVEMSGSRSFENSDRMRNSESESMRGTESMRDSDGMREDEMMRNTDRMRSGSERMRDSDRMIDSDRVRDSNRMRDSQRAMGDSQRMRDTESERSDQNSDRVRDSNRIRDSEWMSSSLAVESEPGLREENRMRDSERMRDVESDWAMRESGERLRDSDRMTGSDRMPRQTDQSDLERSRDSDRQTNPARKSSTGFDNMYMRDDIDSERMRDLDSGRMTNSGGQRKSTRFENLRADIDSERMRDSEGLTNSHSERKSTGLENARVDIDHESDRMRSFSDRMRDSDRMGQSSDDMMDADSMRGADRMRDSERMQGSDKMREMERIRESERNLGNNFENSVSGSAMMRDVDSDRMTASGRTRGLGRTRDAEKMKGSAAESTDFESMKESESEMMRDSNRATDEERMRTLQGEMDSDKVRSPYRATESMQDLEDMSPGIDRLRNSDTWDSDASLIGDADLRKDGTSRMGPSSCRDGASCRSSKDLERMESRAARDWEHFRSDRHSTDAAMTSTQMTESEGKDTSATAVSNCRLNGADHNCRNRASDKEIRGSQNLMADSETMDKSKDSDEGLPNSCRLNGADCRNMAHDGEIRGSQNHDMMESERMSISADSEENLANSCRLNGADCRNMATDGEIRGFQNHNMMDSNRMGMSTEAEEELGNTCRPNGGDCRFTPDLQTESSHGQPGDSEIGSTRVSSCSDNDHDCRKPAGNTEGQKGSEGIMHRRRNDQELVPGPRMSSRTDHSKWMDSERKTSESTITNAGRMNSEQALTMADHDPEMKRSDSETMIGSRKVSSGRSTGSMATDHAEMGNSRMGGAEMAQMTSEQSNTEMTTGPRMDTKDSLSASNAQVDGSGMKSSEMMETVDSRAAGSTMEPSSCPKGADCRTKSEAMHMMNSRDAEIMGPKDDQSRNMHTGSKKQSSERRGLTMHQEGMDSEESEMALRRKFDNLSSSQLVTSDSKMDSLKKRMGLQKVLSGLRTTVRIHGDN